MINVFMIFLYYQIAQNGNLSALYQCLWVIFYETLGIWHAPPPPGTGDTRITMCLEYNGAVTHSECEFGILLCEQKSLAQEKRDQDL